MNVEDFVFSVVIYEIFVWFVDVQALKNPLVSGFLWSVDVIILLGTLASYLFYITKHYRLSSVQSPSSAAISRMWSKISSAITNPAR